MGLKENIYRIRTGAGLTQVKFAEKFGVSHQSVQKWESGESKPDLENVIRIARTFGVSVDCLLFDSNTRTEEELPQNKKLVPTYDGAHRWELYCEDLECEYQQSFEEGLDIAEYEDLFRTVAKLSNNEHKRQMADVLFDIILNARMRADYPYNEPSELDAIKALRVPCDTVLGEADTKTLRDKVAGAWYGRICGCLLGKPLEGIRSGELDLFLKGSGNYPLHRYLQASDITQDVIDKYKFPFSGRVGCCADRIECAPVDDDTNYTVLYQRIVDRCGKDFASLDVARAWLQYQPKNAYCTAERVAFCNFVKGYMPPDSAAYQNPYREWIGAQIRADYFGYINPGNPEMAAEMAWRDASVSHVKNGIYGEMFAAAMIAAAAVCDDTVEIIRCGLAQIPATSRLYEAIERLLARYRDGVTETECFRDIQNRWDDYNQHHWCHTISNAEIVVAALLYGKNGFAESICIAVQAGFDTDCNGATVGSIMGMKNGVASIGADWIAPLHGVQDTSIFGVGRVSIESLIDQTVRHIEG
ncbi:MAG: ADP-ribosylglycohydrolase family protein [Clostridia bacterium]|nr:ADP-ribosylglycohydrolase family protein [Clostridia bacterium]